MPDHGHQRVDRRVRMCLDARVHALRRDPHDPCAAACSQHRVERRAVLGDDVRHQLGHAVREQRAREVHELPAPAAKLDPRHGSHIIA